MYEFLIYIAVALLTYLFGYMVSVFANSIYIDPDEIKEAFPQLSEKRRNQLEKFTSNPRAFFQIGVLVRLTTSIIIGVTAILIAETTTELTGLTRYATYPALLLLFWLSAVIFLIYHPRRVSPQSAKSGLIRFLPLFNFAYILGTPLLRLLGRIPAPNKTAKISEEHKEDIVERAIETLAETAGIDSPVIEEDEKEMIHQIFQLDITTVEEIMIPRIDIVGFEKTAIIKEIRETIRRHGYSRYPVFEENIDNIIGTLYVKDLLLLNERQRKNFELQDFIREPVLVSESRKIDQLLAELKKTKTHIAIVIDEFGGTAGLVTLEDILEEIVGEIEDEHDPGQQESILLLENGTFEVSGSCPLEELADRLDVELENDDFETVGGMIYDMVGSVPLEGTTLSWKNARIKVLKVHGQRILKVLVMPQPSESHPRV